MGAEAASAPSIVQKGRFGPVREYVASGTVQDLVILLSDQRGWDAAAEGLAQKLAGTGHEVLGIDLALYQNNLNLSHDTCFFPSGELSDLSYEVQKRLPFPQYRAPTLVGMGAGAAMAYAITAQAPPTSLKAGIGLGFCPAYASRVPFCPGAASTAAANGFTYQPAPQMETPWQATLASACPQHDLTGFMTAIPAARILDAATSAGAAPDIVVNQALASLANAAAGQTAANVADLPLTELPAPPGARGTQMAIIYSGDGGWRDIDRSIATVLAARGVPVVGVDDLRYFWRKHTPEQVGADLERLITHYSTAFNRPNVILVGYSFGANVLPFAVNRLSKATRKQVRLLALLGFAAEADFEITAEGYFGESSDAALPTLPEIKRLGALPVLCVRGADETDSACTAPELARAQPLVMGGGHHFGGDYEKIAGEIMKATGKN